MTNKETSHDQTEDLQDFIRSALGIHARGDGGRFTVDPMTMLTERRPALHAAAILLCSLEAMCDDPDFRKGMPLPDDVPEDGRDSFCEGIAFGLHLAYMLMKELQDKPEVTLVDMLVIVDKLSTE